MAPLAPDHGNRPSAPAKRRWLLAAGGVLTVAGIGALPFSEERPHPASNTQHLSPQPSHSTRSLSSPDRRLERIVSPGGNAKARAAREVPWSEEEKEQLRIRAQNDPRGFGEWAATLPAGANRRFALDSAALAWGASDPSSAAAWAGSLSRGTERTQALTHIASEAVRRDPHLALELACSLPEPAMEDILPRAAAEWAVTEPVAATEWASRISSASLRAVALARIATAWSERDPVAAATMVLQDLPADRLQADAIVSIVQRWARQSPAGATDWVNQFPDGDLRNAAMECLAQAAAGKK